LVSNTLYSYTVIGHTYAFQNLKIPTNQSLSLTSTKFILIVGLLAVLFLFHFNTVVESTSLEHSDEKWDDLSSEDFDFEKRLASAKFASGLGKRLASAKFASGLGKRLASAKFASGLGKRLASAKFASGLGKRSINK
ncbi:unnamed protein product, partial [Rotaria sordida]